MMKYLGVDLGSSRTGLAISDPTGFLASPYSVLHIKNRDDLLMKITEIVLSEEIGSVVVGFPKHMNGDIGDKARESAEFAGKLKELCKIPVTLRDERCTTVEAHNILSSVNVRGKRRKAVVDAVAAVLILQDFLDSVK